LLSAKQFCSLCEFMKFVSLGLLLVLLFAACSNEKQTNSQNTNHPGETASVKPGQSSHQPIQFPRDEGVHRDAPIEWWYLNSQFSDAAGKKYSFFFCKFSTGRHLVSLYDKSADKIWVKDYYESVNAAENKLDLSSITGKWKQAKAPFNYDFLYDFEGVTLELALKATKKPFLPEGDGFISMGENGSSYYYAITDLTLAGTLKTGTNQPPIQIDGKAWVDHQWGSWDWVKDFSQWKWYSVKLDNGVDLMLFNIYKDKKLINSYCGYIDAENKQYHKLPCELVTREYYTDASRGKWQKKVDLEISSLPNTKLTLTSENDLQFIQPLVLWEGSMKVAGTFKGEPVKGTAYGELNRPD
jgi:predicted secreted hydrolase